MYLERIIRFVFGAQLGLKSLARLLRRLGQSAKAGVGPLQAWDHEVRSAANAAQRRKFELVRDQLANGEPLHVAMRNCDGLFPRLTSQMAEIGESVGRMDEVLLGLADYYDRLLTLRRTFLMGILWPVIQLVMAIMVIGLLIFILGMLPTEIDILGFGLLGTRGVIIYFAGVFTIFGIGTLAVSGLFRGWYGTAPVRMAMRIPAVGGYLRDTALARLTWTLAMALEAGMDALRSLQMALDSTENVVYQATSLDAMQGIRNGREFHEILRHTGVFPPEFVNSLEAAELAGSETTSLLHLSNQYSERAKASSHIISLGASFLIWGAIAMLIIAMIFRLAFFYINVLNDAAGI
jgi:type IV pilus assembly protein PilC